LIRAGRISLGLSKVLVEAGHAQAVVVHKGDRLRVVDIEGQQVCDFFAFALSDPLEYFSVSETRAALMTMNPHVGAALYSNRGRELIFWERDTVGVHDSRAAACDLLRYWLLGVDHHRSCKQNLLAALSELDVWVPVVPDPLNLFQNTTFETDTGYTVRPSRSEPGDYVEFRALIDLIVVGSACPMDLTSLNGPGPTNVMLEVHGRTDSSKSLHSADGPSSC
jgi:uncharacterized protein YcgI (DUF1989 family)